MSEADTIERIDFDRRYAVAGYGGIAFYLLGYGTVEEYDGDVLVCAEADCDHGLSELCWAPGSTSIVIDHEHVRAVMVGDDREHVVCVDDLTPLDDEDYCAVCGQIGCSHDGRE